MRARIDHSKAIMLIFVLFSVASASAIESGQSESGVAGPNRTNFHLLSASAGDAAVVSVGFEYQNCYQPGSRILNSDDSEIARGNSFVDSVSLPASSSYRVEITTNQFCPVDTPYNLHFLKVPGATEYGVLAESGTVTGAIARGDIDSYEFSVPAGTEIALNVESIGADWNPIWNLYPHSGGAPYSGSSTTNLLLFNGGKYTLMVRTADPLGFGDYKLTYTIPGLTDVQPESVPFPFWAILVSLAIFVIFGAKATKPRM